MRLWLADLQWRSFFAPIPTATLASALLLVTQTQSHVADPQPKQILMLHSFGLRFKPWTDYAEGIRAEIGSRRHVEFQDHSLVTARLNDDNSDKPFVEYLYSLNRERPPDLIVAIGAPAANFVQRHRADLFPRTPMVFTAVERRRVNFDKLTEYDTVVASSNNLADILEKSVLHVLPHTKTIAIAIGASPNELFWLKERRRETARLAGRVQFRWYNDMSFEAILKDAASLPPDTAIYWQFLNVDAAGVAYEGAHALNRLSAAASRASAVMT